MITHEISKPEVKTPTVSIVREAKRVLGISWGGTHDRPHDRYMDKISYSRWIEYEVKTKFKVGDMATLVYNRVEAGKVPSPSFVIDSIQEIHWMAPKDTSLQEPSCINVKLDNGSHVNYPPSRLRKLTTEEINLVNLRNQKTKESSTIKTINGKFCRVCDATGEILHTYEN